jgi:FMN-dependent NADH-azoreductase
MHSFSSLATFKAWIDQIARTGETFNFIMQGQEKYALQHIKCVRLRKGFSRPS